ncbi:MAG: ferrous iron transport protein A [Gemmatimonadetes bacterium]|nr:ferrous iron transport protein A [Gemmatimonadota bacterium]
MHADAVSLTRLAEGARGWVTELCGPYDSPMTHLVAVGVLPGAEVELVQRYPAFVLRIGNTEFAIDDALAARVRVRQTGGPAD